MDKPRLIKTRMVIVQRNTTTYVLKYHKKKYFLKVIALCSLILFILKRKKILCKISTIILSIYVNTQKLAIATILKIIYIILINNSINHGII